MSARTDVAPPWLRERPIAHRGLHDGARVPENSLAAFERAAAAGHPIELDVHRLRDGNVVVFHDGGLARLTGDSRAVAELSAADLAPLRLSGTDERIPLLAEVLEAVAGRVPLLVEIKSMGPIIGPLEEATLGLLRGYRGELAVQSFDPRSMAFFRARAPEIVRGQLSFAHAGMRGQPLRRLVLANLLCNLVSRPHFVAYHVDALPTVATRLVRARGLPLLAWTVRTPAQRAHAARWADNVIFEE
ncbi:MAG: glycerophosphodiester phosphodiesterase [Chthonomonadales bacterium]|nr:glycerophosphodiester phosphodiesterase [Chthonomonadales bacterium]